MLENAVISPRRDIILAALAAIVGCAGGGWAATATYVLNVSASVPAVATLSVSPVAFPALSSAGTTTAFSAVSVTCPPGNALSIALDGGTNAASGQRRMSNGTAFIDYNLYQPNAAGTALSSPPVAWGNGGTTVTGTPFTATCNGGAQAFNVYAQVPSGQTLPSGTYSDAVTVTLTY